MPFNVPNLLTFLRLGLIPFFIIALLRGEPAKALVLFGIAGISDALDGFFARVFDQRSVLGAYLDPIADKLLLTSAFIVLTVAPMEGMVAIPIWVTVLVIARDVLILVVALVLALALSISEFKPSVLGKLNTVVQVTAVVLVMASGFSGSAHTPATIGIYLVGALTVASGLDYIRSVSQKAADT